jgi:hypothetical protein
MRGRSAWLRLRRDSGTTEASATPGVAWLAQVAGDRSGFTSIKTSAATATPIQLLTPPVFVLTEVASTGPLAAGTYYVTGSALLEVAAGDDDGNDARHRRSRRER